MVSPPKQGRLITSGSGQAVGLVQVLGDVNFLTTRLGLLLLRCGVDEGETHFFGEGVI